MKAIKTLVTGAGGFIGSHLVEALVGAGAEVRVFLRYNSRGDLGLLDQLPGDIQASLKIFWGDLKDPEALRLPMKNCDVVYHLGSLIAIPYSYVHPTDFVQTNIIGTTNVLNRCLELDVKKVVHISTSEVYGTALYTPIDEKHPLQAQSPYAATKIGADKLADSYYRSFGLPVAIARPFNTYGPRQSARAVVPTIILQALMGKKVRLGSLHPTRDLNFVEDTVKGIMAVAESDKVVGEVINIGSGREISIGDLADMIFSIVGEKLPIQTDTDRVRPEKSEVERLLCDNSKARKMLGWEPMVSLQEGLEKTVDWFRSNMKRYRADFMV
jgi:dTDP-glucose 4,6-dehydratase